MTGGDRATWITTLGMMELAEKITVFPAACTDTAGNIMHSRKVLSRNALGKDLVRISND